MTGPVSQQGTSYAGGGSFGLDLSMKMPGLPGGGGDGAAGAAKGAEGAAGAAEGAAGAAKGAEGAAGAMSKVDGIMKGLGLGLMNLDVPVYKAQVGLLNVESGEIYLI